MKTFRFLTLGSLLLATLPACDRRESQLPAPPLASPQPDETEIERRVQQRLAEERLTEDQKRAREREQELAKRETALERRERELREQAEAAAQTPTPVAADPAAPEPERAETAGSYQIFYDALAPHGGWMEVDPYGYVWQPREAVRDSRWRPYTDGRWAHTDYGWTWISNEPFGWATYHYGRWVKLRRLGWCWVPGEQWAPAWVAWRTSDRYIGWAPLPPEARFDGASGIHEWADSRFEIGASDYAFVPASDLGEERVESAVLPPEQNITIVNETTNVTNIVQNNNQLIINNGPNFQAVQAHSRRPISQFKVERTANERGGQRATVVKGNTVQFSAPVIRKNNAQARPAQAQPHVADTRAQGAVMPAQKRPGAIPQQAAQAAIPQPTAVPSVAAQPVFTPAAQPSATPEARAAKLQEQAEQRRAAMAAQQTERARVQEQKQQAAAQRLQAIEAQKNAAEKAVPSRLPAQPVASAAPQRPARESSAQRGEETPALPAATPAIPQPIHRPDARPQEQGRVRATPPLQVPDLPNEDVRKLPRSHQPQQQQQRGQKLAPERLPAMPQQSQQSQQPQQAAEPAGSPSPGLIPHGRR